MASKLKAMSARNGRKSPKVHPALASTTVHGSCATAPPWSGNVPTILRGNCAGIKVQELTKHITLGPSKCQG